MNEVEIKFEREERDGIIPVGTYLLDAAKRLGIDLQGEEFGEKEFFVFQITGGSKLLSAPTATEIELLSAERRARGERFACHAKIEKSGEITVMTAKKKEETKPEAEEVHDEYRKKFEELPLEKKIASLFELEAITLGETFSFVLNSPSMIVSKVMDVLAEFGLKLEDEARKQTRPNEHQTGSDNDNEPSVKEEKKEGDDEPSVKEDTNENLPGTEPPPPSV
jgi:hypothetical protein